MIKLGNIWLDKEELQELMTILERQETSDRDKIGEHIQSNNIEYIVIDDYDIEVLSVKW